MEGKAMDEALYRGQQAVARLFGPHAILGGELGTPKRPGELRIVVDGRLLGRGGNFEQALADVTTRATSTPRRAAR
jgi:hypothetical protein